MPVSQRVIFTAIPDGFDSRQALLNLHVAPRLSITSDVQPNILDQFPAWREWAATINAATIRVLVDGTEIGAERVATARLDIWTALFPGTTRVQTHAFQDLRGHDVLTYPLGELAAAIESDYVDLAGQDGGQLPIAKKLGRIAGYAPPRGFDRDAAVELLRTTKSAEDLSRTSIAIGLLAAYHQPLGTQKPMIAKPDNKEDGHVETAFLGAERIDMPTPKEIVERFDFHRIVAAVGQHPALMRACGLVVPLRLKLGDLPTGDFTIAVQIDWKTGDIATETDICPRTRARRDADDFRARPRASGVLRGGWLRMDPARFNLVAMDVDGAGLALKNMAINLPKMEEERFDDERFDTDHRLAQTGTPRIRTAGIQLAQSRRDLAIRGMFERSGSINDLAAANGTPELFAEDLIRGWRADIGDVKSGRWQSLLRFDGDYEFVQAGGQLTTQDEETALQLAAGKAADGSDPKLLKASEALFAWSGWSLAAPQPGLAIMPDDTTHDDAPNTVPDGLPLKVSPTAHPGSLPLLRFGRSYRARMRYADLAGGGIRWFVKPATVPGVESDPYFFGRYEPVEPPALTLIEGDALPKDGESMGRAALRTMDDAAANDVSARRNIVPPHVGVRFAELHGVLDRDGRPDPARYQTLVDRDKDYAEQLVPGTAFDPDTGDVTPYDTKFAIGPEAAQTPYLYDPLAAGAALKIAGVPGINPDKIWPVSFTGDAWDADAPTNWPDARGFSLHASETEPTGWDATTRMFTVKLAPAERARIRVSALVPKRGIALFKLLERLAVAAESNDEAKKRYEATRLAISRGQHWMFTPWRTVELVHAVQRPLIVPDYQILGASRGRDEVAARIMSTTPVHAKSTVRIDTDAHWIEIDDTRGDGPDIRTLDSDAFSRPFARLDWPNLVAQRLSDRHVFNDTRARYVGYRMRATTRFREFMPIKIRAQPELLDRTSERRATWVPASSPPAAPVIRYVVPTFGWWEGDAPGGGRRIWREGGGLRVYLDRPWFSSGSNEMLAVLLPRVADVGPNDDLRDFVSQWGADPVWAGPRVRTIAPRRQDLPRRVDRGPIPYDFGDPANPVDIPDGAAAGDGFSFLNLRPQGAPDAVRVEAVPHAVGYDPGRKLWYCDIVVKPGTAYFPFIRLALARYQPHAIAGCELSSVAMASFQQLSPDRVATVVPAGGFGGRGRRVSVFGRTPGEGFSLPSAGNIRVQLQRLSAGGDPDLDWRDTPQGQPPQPTPDFEIGINTVARSRSVFNVARNVLSGDQRGLLQQAARLDQGSLIGQIGQLPGVFDLLLPPLIHEETLLLPSHGGDRLRLMITEVERYRTEDETGRAAPAPVERIVYAATIEV